ncbi:hypothetical protein [Spirosoma fluviale]|uniref:Uncharacterized protein n=1 Tax=Spirosoma fluviale TaxID=1597977 RepID=A0A286G8S8_9BACT|nr:hypothetical protein [Spirosoma fluviale]SOD91905.1 hypothetical protein SAMN06269250_3699 [Spirosoma fluviale]
MRKSLFVITILSTLCFFQCTPDQPATSVINKEQAARTLLDNEVNQLVGKWRIQESIVEPRQFNPYQVELAIVKDTVLRDLATLTIRPAATTNRLTQGWPSSHYTGLDGTLDYGSKSYPIYINLVIPDEVTSTGRGIVKLFNFLPGTFEPEAEAILFKKLGFFHTDFTLTTPSDSSVMHWRDTGQVSSIGLTQVKLIKQP